MKANKRHMPPGWAMKFFRWFANDHLYEAILGDMIELHSRRHEKLGKRRANLLFIFTVFSFLQPFAIREQRQSQPSNNIAMFKNFIKITWRTMTRQKMYTGIKIGGFALGLATCILIALFIRHELSYDNFYKEKSRVFRAYNHFAGPDDSRWTSFPANFAKVVKSGFPEVEESARLIPFKWFNAGNNLIRRENQVENSYEENFVYADPELIDVLEIPLLKGNPKKALRNPLTIVISERIAKKYFGDKDPVGERIILNEDTSKPYVIDGVMETFRANSHLNFDFMITLSEVEFWPGEQNSWCCWNYNVYMRLRPDADPRALEEKMLSIRETHYVSFLKETGDIRREDVKKYHTFKLQPVSDIYLDIQEVDDDGHGDMRYIILFGAIAVFILLLACINFINLSTAKSANRAKEVGLRKAVGSVRGYLVRQFLTESMFYSFVSFAIALLMVWVALPYFSNLAGKPLSVPWNEWWLAPVLLCAALMIGLIAGIYPAFYLSAFKPIDVLKGNVSRGSRRSGLRSAMVVFQFTTSIILIVGTFVIYKQMNFILHTKIGFDKDQVILVQGVNTLDKQQKTFKEELRKLANVKDVTIGNYLPVAGTNRDQNSFWREGKSTEEKGIGAQKWYVDDDYINTLGINLIEGRNFDENIASDSNAIIINQSMAKAFGFEHPIGEHIQTWEPYVVIGVAEDFHFESMKGKIGSLALVRGNGGSVASVKVNTTKMTDMLANIESVWGKFMPNQPFRFAFMDDSYARMYDDVQRMGYVFACFAGLAIIVACLGLFALSAFMVEQRTKEICIRLVLGASMKTVFRLLTQNFVKLVVISFFIATPLAWYMMRRWLEDFEYKIDLTWDVFLFSGILSVLIALVTVSYQSIRAALSKPVEGLRSE